MDKKDISKMKDENMKEEKRKGEVVENHTRFYHRPISDKISYALLLLVAALFLVAINYLVLEDGGTPTPGYAGTTAELYLYPTEVAVDLGETVDIEVRLDTRSNEVSAVDVSLSAWEGVTIMSIDPNYDSFATFAPIDGNGLFDENTAISNQKFGAVQYDADTVGLLEEVVGDGIVVATVTVRADLPGSLYLSLTKNSLSTDESNVFVSNFISSVDILESSTESVHIVSDCTPSCDYKECGSDGCLGSCGTCQGGEECRGYSCVQEGFKEEGPRRTLFGE